MRRHTLHMLLLCMAGLLGCEKQTDWSVKPGHTPTLVVDAVVTNELKKQQVALTYSFSEISGQPVPVSQAKVRIQEGIRIYSFTEKPVGSGVYLSDTVFAGVVGKRYNLRITHNEKVYSAEAYMVGVTNPDEIEWNPVSATLYELAGLPDDYDPNSFSCTQYHIDWSFLPGHDTLPDEETHALLYYYTLPTIDVSQEFALQGRERVYFPAGAQIVCRKYSLTPEHAAYIRELMFETRWSGGLFDEARSNLSSNVNNGALGYFGLCSVAEKKAVVQ